MRKSYRKKHKQNKTKQKENNNNNNKKTCHSPIFLFSVEGSRSMISLSRLDISGRGFNALFSLLFHRYNNSNTKVFVFQVAELPLGQSVKFTFKATANSPLPQSIFVVLPVYLAYATLPFNLLPLEGRKYEHNSDQVRFFRISVGSRFFVQCSTHTPSAFPAFPYGCGALKCRG